MANLSCEAEVARIHGIQGVTDGERSVLIEGAKNVKYIQILTCVGLNQNLNDADLEYAINQTNLFRERSLAGMRLREDVFANKAQDQSLSQLERQAYRDSLALIPEEIRKENQRAERLISQIRAAN